MMRVFGGYVLAFCMILAIGSAVLAEGFQMERVTIGTRWVEDEDQQNWLYFNSNADYEWTRFNLQGKFYVPSLSENWIDHHGVDDEYSGLMANFRFPQLSRGLDANLGYKWNEDYRVYLYGVGYGFSPAQYLNLGFHYDIANRIALSDNPGAANNGNTGDNGIDDEDDYAGDLDKQILEFTLRYNPKVWGYSLTAQQLDYQYEKNDYDKLRYVLDQDVNWQATSRINLGLRYVTKTTEYDNASKKDGDSDWVKLYGSWKWDQYWSWSGAYIQSDYSDNGEEADCSGWNIKAKYTSDSNWWAAAKLYIYDRTYNDEYRDENLDVSDIDADYNSRTQQVLAVEYEQKLEAFTYNLEVFVKNFDYDDADKDLKPAKHDYKDGSDAGIIGAIGWDWAKWRWVFRAAPNGDLTTRKANYELKATYKF
jgi:hypothetical protein